MTIDHTGNVGIGSTSPRSLLDVNGAILAVAFVQGPAEISAFRVTASPNFPKKLIYTQIISSSGGNISPAGNYTVVWATFPIK